MAYGIWRHGGKKKKQTQHRKNRAEKRSQGENMEYIKQSYLIRPSQEDPWIEKTVRTSNRKKMTKKKNERQQSRDDKYNVGYE